MSMYPFSLHYFYISLSKKWREKEQMNPIPYIEHSFLSIDRKIFVKYNTALSFFFSSSYPRQLTTSTPPHTTIRGAVRLLNQTKS